MAQNYINKASIKVGNTTDTYLVEPTLYSAASTSDSGGAYTATLDNFGLTTGATVQIKFSVTNKASATLNVNSTGAKTIFYNNAAITASTLKANHTYTLVYDGTLNSNNGGWVLVGDIDALYSAGTGLSLSGTTFNHSNSITEKSSYGSTATTASANGGTIKVTDVQYDDCGHITASTDRTITLSQKTYNFSGVSFTSGNSSNGTHAADSITSNGHWYYSSQGPVSTLGAQSTDGALYTQAYSADWVGQIAQDYRDGQLFVRSKNNKVWQDWLAIPMFTTTTGGLGSASKPIYIDTSGKLQACTNSIPTKISDLTNDSTFVSSSGVTKITIKSSGAITGGSNTAVTTEGTWTIGHSTSDGYKHVPATGTTSNGKFLKAGNSAGSFSWESIAASDIPTASTSQAGVTTLSAAADDSSKAATAKSVYDLTQTVNGIVSAADALVFKNTITGKATTQNSGAGALTPAANCGDTYMVDAEGYVNGLPVEIGDLVICLTDNTPAATTSGNNKFDTANIRNKWVIIQTNIDSALFKGTNTFTDGHILIADGANGKVKDGGTTIANATVAAAGKATNDSDGKKISTTYLKLSGGTMTGVLTVKGNQYNDAYDGALNMNNSDIYGLNSIYTADTSDGAGEGIHFYRDATHVDTLWMNGGALLFVPNRALGTSTTRANSEKVLRGPAAITDGYVFAASSTDGLTKQIQATNSNTASTIVQRDASGNFSAGTITAALSGNATSAGKFNSNRTIKLTGAVTGSATTDGSSGWEIATTKNHTHPVSELTWAGGVNLATSATANGQEWSLDLTPGSYTGTYWHVWSAKNSKSILCCYPDDNKVTVPNGGFQSQRIIPNTGTYTAAKDNGSSSSNRYQPLLWTFNLGIAASQLTTGLTICITMPSAGHDYGIFLSVDNGTTYKPVSSNTGTNRLTTHYPNGSTLILCYDPNGQTNSVFPIAGSTSRTNVSGGCWRPISSYDDGNPGDWNLRQYEIKAQTALTGVHIVGGTDSGYNNVDSGTAFDIRYAVLYAGSNISAGAKGSNNFIHHYSVNVRNSANSNISGWTANKNLYIKGTIDGYLFTPISGGNPYVQDITAADDGYVYYYIGRTYGGNAITFDATGAKIYWYKDGKIQPYTGYATATSRAAITTTTNAVAYYSDTTGTFAKLSSAKGALYATSTNGALSFGKLPVGEGGTGCDTLTSGELLVGNGTSAVTTRGIYTLSAAGDSGWNTTANRTKIPDMSFIAYWNGAYNGNSSNITKVGTITSGTWKGTAIAASYIGEHSTDKLTSGTLGTARGGLGNNSFTASRLLYTESATKISSTTSIYAGTDSISINATAAPDNSGKFQVKGTSTMQHILPEADTTYDLGNHASLRWRTAYLTTSLCVSAKNVVNAYNTNGKGTFIGPAVMSICQTAAGDGLYLMGAAAQYGRMFINTIGTASAVGETWLYLGNSTASGTAKNAKGAIRLYHTNATYGDYYAHGWWSSGGISDYTMVGATSTTKNTEAWTTVIFGNANATNTTNAHSRGNLRIYSESTTYTDIRSQGGYSKIFYLPKYNGNMYAVHIGTSAVGGNTAGSAQPVYVPADGRVTAITNAIGVSYGGTGTTTAPTQYGVIYGASASAYACTSAGANGQFLMATNTSPTWSSPTKTLIYTLTSSDFTLNDTTYTYSISESFATTSPVTNVTATIIQGWAYLPATLYVDTDTDETITFTTSKPLGGTVKVQVVLTRE